jgi:Uma2 family endonuclease
VYNPSVEARYELEEPATALSTLGPFREADYWALPDEPRCELLYGRLILAPAPSLRHQRALIQLVACFLEWARKLGGEALCAPLDVRLADHSVVQPDLMYVTPERRAILRQRVIGAPDLLVEILSPSTARRDRGAKLRLYAESGVREYWIVDPAAATFEFLVLRDGRFTVELPVDGRYVSPAVPGIELDLAAFWAAVPSDED